MSGFIDLQVNGYAGADFNSDAVTLGEIESACQRLQADGNASILATVITDQPDAMMRRLQAVVNARNESAIARDVIAGIHIEGPFLNEAPGYIGAHPVTAARPADTALMQDLLDAAGGLTRIVTLAPERDPEMATTRFLADRGITVAAGHCDASREQLKACIRAGLSMYTHLGNGCPSSMHRHDNIVQRVLSLADQLTISWIADGAHVPLFALKNYLAAATVERSVVVTDAISAAGLGPGVYTLGNQQVEIGEDLVPWSADRTHFVGSATTMPRMETNLRSIGLSNEEVDWLLRLGPQQIIAS